MARSIIIVQEHTPAFRVPFYDALRFLLERRNVRLDLIYAPNQNNTFLQGQIEWGKAVPIKRLGPFSWQPVVQLTRGKDLVIVQQELKYVINPILQLLEKFGRAPVAYWGHGKNFQNAESNLLGYIKQKMSKSAHWWFAYNDLSAQIVKNLGYPPERITSVGNAIDTAGLVTRREELSAEEIDGIRRELGLCSENVAVYTGGLYANKRLPFLIESARLIREEIPDFELIVIGDGPERERVRSAAASHSWLHMVGPKTDHEKVAYWALSKMLLMPGGVGLVILDSFALGVPMVTTDTRLHGPEIDYLRDGKNGLLVSCGDSAAHYAAAVVSLFRDPERLAALTREARQSAALYTVEKMASNFAEGVIQALDSPRLPR